MIAKANTGNVYQKQAKALHNIYAYLNILQQRQTEAPIWKTKFCGFEKTPHNFIIS